MIAGMLLMSSQIPRSQVIPRTSKRALSSLHPAGARPIARPRPATRAAPPKRGMAEVWIFSSPGRATKPQRKATTRMTGIATSVVTNAIMTGIKANETGSWLFIDSVTDAPLGRRLGWYLNFFFVLGRECRKVGADGISHEPGFRLRQAR